MRPPFDCVVERFFGSRRRKLFRYSGIRVKHAVGLSPPDFFCATGARCPLFFFVGRWVRGYVGLQHSPSSFVAFNTTPGSPPGFQAELGGLIPPEGGGGLFFSPPPSKPLLSEPHRADPPGLDCVDPPRPGIDTIVVALEFADHGSLQVSPHSFRCPRPAAVGFMVGSFSRRTPPQPLGGRGDVSSPQLFPPPDTEPQRLRPEGSWPLA